LFEQSANSRDSIAKAGHATKFPHREDKATATQVFDRENTARQLSSSSPQFGSLPICSLERTVSGFL
jgi:hypothetical protein